MDKWKCGSCNYIVVAKDVPRICPNCGHKTEFELFNELLPPFTPIYDE
jgi:rubrerythrin